MRVAEIMTPDVEVAAPDDWVQTAAALMRDNGAGVLPVCESGRLVGMITDRDITIRAVAEGKSPSGCIVREVMTEPVNYAFEDDEVDDVARKMAQWQVHRLPVLNREKELVGIVSVSDISLEARDQKSTAQAVHGIARPSTQHKQ